MSMNVFNSTGTSFLGPQPFAFDRARMLAGLPAAFVTPGITNGPLEETYLPVDLDGSNPPPPGAPGVFVEFPSGGVYRVFHFNADFVTPANTTFTLFSSPPAAGFTSFAGTGSQTGTSSRWGDYSALTIDPVDDCTFWFTSEYYVTTSSFNWRTRIASFKFATCGGGSPTPTPTPSPSPTPTPTPNPVPNAPSSLSGTAVGPTPVRKLRVLEYDRRKDSETVTTGKTQTTDYARAILSRVIRVT